jgi:hypothetical protein
MAVGMYLVLGGLLRLPLWSTTRIVVQAGRMKRGKVVDLDAIMLELAARLSHFVKLDTYKKRRLDATLRSAGMHITAETYLVRAVLRGLFVCFFALPLFFIMPVLSMVAILAGIGVYSKEIQAAGIILRQKREDIEAELPRFVATISQSLIASRDVLSILERYRKTAGQGLKSELDITIADMHSGNLETALVRFETRIGSSMLSDTVRGLIGVLRGDNNSAFFDDLAHEFKHREVDRLKRIARKRPGRIRKFSALLIVCFLLTWGTVLLLQILGAAQSLF